MELFEASMRGAVANDRLYTSGRSDLETFGIPASRRENSEVLEDVGAVAKPAQPAAVPTQHTLGNLDQSKPGYASASILDFTLTYDDGTSKEWPLNVACYLYISVDDERSATGRNERVLFRWNNGGQKTESSIMHNPHWKRRLFLPGAVRFYAAFASMPIWDYRYDGPNSTAVLGYPNHSIHEGWPWTGGGFWGGFSNVVELVPGTKNSWDVPLRATEQTSYERPMGQSPHRVVANYLLRIRFDVEDADAPAPVAGGAWAQKPAPIIEGIEVTQAIQHYWSEAGPDNSLPLLAHRSTCARVYADGFGHSFPNATCSLQVLDENERFLDQGYLVKGASCSQIEASFVLINRQVLNDSFNFVLPPMRGPGKAILRATIHVPSLPEVSLDYIAEFAPAPPTIHVLVSSISRFLGEEIERGGHAPLVNHVQSIDQIRVDSDAMQAPNALAVSSIYPVADEVDGPGLSCFLFPDIGLLDPILPGEDQKWWEELLNFRWQARYWGPSPSLTIGMLPDGLAVASGRNVVGRQASGTRTCIAELRNAGHELGHALGLAHAPGPDVERAETDYPSGSTLIWDTGVHVQLLWWIWLRNASPDAALLRSAIRPGLDCTDFMVSDAGGRKPQDLWVSPFRWLQLLKALRAWPNTEPTTV